jgi:hypothetical protein
MCMKSTIKIFVILSLLILSMLVLGCIGNTGNPSPSPTLIPTATVSVITATPTPLPTPTQLPITGPQNIVQTTNGRTYPTYSPIANGSPVPYFSASGGQLTNGR